MLIMISGLSAIAIGFALVGLCGVSGFADAGDRNLERWRLCA